MNNVNTYNINILVIIFAWHEKERRKVVDKIDGLKK